MDAPPPPVDLQRCYHVGVRVADVDDAMAELTATAGTRWASVQHADDRAVWTPESGLEEVALTFVYSADGPLHVELLAGQEGSVWDAGDRPGTHHLGVWSDDVAADTERCLAAGWRLSAAARAPEDGFGSFVYVEPPSGLIVELVTSAAKPRFETWWAGGPMGGEREAR